MRLRWKIMMPLYKLHDLIWEYCFMRPMVGLANWRMKRRGSDVRYIIYREKYGDHRSDDELV